MIDKISKTLSLVIAGACIWSFVSAPDSSLSGLPPSSRAVLHAFEALGSLAVPLGLIWFGDYLGEVPMIHGIPMRQSPGVLLKIIGWVILIVLPLIAYWLSGPGW